MGNHLHVLTSNRECRDTEEVKGGGWTGTRRQSVNYRRSRSSVSLITVAGRLIIVVCIRLRSLRRPRSLT